MPRIRRSICTLTACTTACAAVLVLATACKSEARGTADEAGATAKSGDEPDGAPFELTIEAPTMKSGASGHATITIVAGDGFKWNLEYPAKLVFEGEPTRVAMDKKRFEQTKGDFETSDEKASVKVPLEAKSTGEETVTGEARFSVCNDTTCLIETAEVKLALSIRQ